jgi:hypothetical protein
MVRREETGGRDENCRVKSRRFRVQKFKFTS